MCEFCKSFQWGSAKCETDKYGSRIVIAGGITRFQRDQQFNFCPVCGASRKEVECEKHNSDLERNRIETEKYLNDPNTRVFINHNFDLGIESFSVEVEKSNGFWLASFYTQGEALRYIADHNLELII